MRRLALLLLVTACGPESPEATTPKPVTSASAAPITSAVAPTPAAAPLPGMKMSVQPGDDFDAYANGAWRDATEIPKERPSWGVGWEVFQRTNERVKELVQAADKNPSPDAKKIATYYAAFMDEKTIEDKGLTPIADLMASVTAIKDKTALAKALGGTVRADTDILNNTAMQTPNAVGLWVAEDLDDPKQYAAFLTQGGASLPSREFYFDPKMNDTRVAFQAHIEKLLKIASIPDEKAKAQRIFELEKKIAETHASREDAGDVDKGDNHWSRKDLDAKAPGMDWNAFLGAVKLDKQQSFTVWHPKAITGLAALVKSEPLDTWKDYLTFHLLDHWSRFLPKAYADEGFAFYGKTLVGIEVQNPRWERALGFVDAALGESVGKLYVEKYFPASEKARVSAMVKNIVAAFGKRVDGLTWMDPKTKARAKAKLGTLQVSVGYPDKWRDYSALVVKPGEAIGNARRAEQFELERNVAKLGKPVDRGEWCMYPHTVNAVNLPVRNALQFPSGFLQPPYLDPNRPSAMDYGAIGAVIGHEISHSFDDSGALFDETGKKSNWWTADDLAHFKASGAALVKQYDGYKPFPDLAVNGKQTLGENIADVAGLSASFDAFHASLNGAEAPAYNGLTGDQQFFLSFAQAWRAKFRPESLRNRILTDGHAPAMYRAATVRNVDGWYAAFGVKAGQGLYLDPKDRVKVW